MSGNDVLELIAQDEAGWRQALERLMETEHSDEWTRCCLDLEAEVTLHLLAEDHALLHATHAPVGQAAADELRRNTRDVFQALSDVMRARRPEGRLVGNLRRALETHVALHAPLVGACSMWTPEQRHEAGNRFAGRKLELIELRVTADPSASAVAARTRFRRPMGNVLQPTMPR